MRHSDASQVNRGTGGRRCTVPAGMPEGWFAPFLLLCLSDGCSYGYRLVEKLAGELGFDETRPEEIYLALWRMEQDGMVLRDPEDGGIGLPDPRYEITEKGDAYLRSWADSLEQHRKEIKHFLHIYKESVGRLSKDRMSDSTRDINGNVTTVLLANGQCLLRAGLLKILSEDESTKVLGEAQSEEEAAVLAQQEKPDVVILDLEEPPAVAREATAQILKVSPPPRVVVVDTQDRPPRFVLSLVAKGVSAYLGKDASPEDLFAAIHGSHRENALDGAPRTALGRAQEEKDTVKGALSMRELEILLLVARGSANREIGRVLNLSEATVKRHLANLYPKIRATSRTEAVRKALSEGWISVQDITHTSDGGATQESRAEVQRI